MLLAFGFWLITYDFKAQVNYVPNPSFEKIVGYDNSVPVNYIWVATPWDTIKGGSGGGNVGIVPSPSINFIGTTLYQVARSGNFMGVIAYYIPSSSLWRGYMRTPLKNNLKSKAYCVTSYFNLINRSQYASDEMSIYIDNGSLACTSTNDVALANAQIKSPTGVFYSDTLNWMKLQGIYNATGNESHLTIGNFKTAALSNANLVYSGAGAQTADYYIDDVSVLEADLPAYAGRDTVLCMGDSIFIGRPPEIGLECLWSNNGSQIATGGGLWVKPATTQTYIVNQDVCGIIKKDTIQVQVKPKYTGANIGIVANTATTCPTNTLTLNVINNPPVTGTYNWLPLGVYTQTGNAVAKAVIPNTTTFTLNLNNNGQNAFCPFKQTASLTVVVPLFTGTPAITPNVNTVCPNDTIQLSLTAVPGNSVNYTWLPNPAFTFTSNLLAKSSIKQTTTYTVNINSSGNNTVCPFTQSINTTISVADTCFKDPTIPNIFTPNNDDVNDVWQIKFPYGYALQELNIYNRWGTLIYERGNLTFNISNLTLLGWDGRTTSGEECTAGVYFYAMKYMDKNGTAKMVKGNLTLMK